MKHILFGVLVGTSVYFILSVAAITYSLATIWIDIITTEVDMKDPVEIGRGEYHNQTSQYWMVVDSAPRCKGSR
jgi:hypothetical protein